ncbi:MAG TPA: peptidoglycan DD-metalloendopeptidase family protein [Bacteroidales bacterium]|nr:peptidoglycan DD-metalloendopeptidase family protein [Bacteroidales bacterium]
MSDKFKYTHVLIKTIGVGLLLLLSISNGYGQDKKQLEEEKNKTLEEIEITNKILKEVEQSKSTGLNKLLIIQKRISLREKLINDINREIYSIDGVIENKNNEILKLENEIKNLKDEYAKMIYYAYKNRSNYIRLMFVLSAEDFNQAYRRMKYFQQYSKYRKQQAEKIVIAQKNLEYEIEQLKDVKDEKISLLSQKEREKQQLSSEKSNENKEISRLKQREKQLRKKLAEKQKAMRELENAIAELIKREAKANKTFKTLTAEEETISVKFEQNKGMHSWPIEKGIVISEFGEQPHPVIKGVKINNYGIDISASEDAKVHTIFEGEVKTVFAVTGQNMAVIIRHGHYLSLYSNLVNVRVKTGDKINKGHHIGDVYSSKDNSGAILHLGIYKEKEAMNPKLWLKNK